MIVNNYISLLTSVTREHNGQKQMLEHRLSLIHDWWKTQSLLISQFSETLYKTIIPDRCPCVAIFKRPGCSGTCGDYVPLVLLYFETLLAVELSTINSDWTPLGPHCNLEFCGTLASLLNDIQNLDIECVGKLAVIACESCTAWKASAYSGDMPSPVYGDILLFTHMVVSTTNSETAVIPQLKRCIQNLIAEGSGMDVVRNSLRLVLSRFNYQNHAEIFSYLVESMMHWRNDHGTELILSNLPTSLQRNEETIPLVLLNNFLTELSESGDWVQAETRLADFKAQLCAFDIVLQSQSLRRSGFRIKQVFNGMGQTLLLWLEKELETSYAQCNQSRKRVRLAVMNVLIQHLSEESFIPEGSLVPVVSRVLRTYVETLIAVRSNDDMCRMESCEAVLSLGCALIYAMGEFNDDTHDMVTQLLIGLLGHTSKLPLFLELDSISVFPHTRRNLLVVRSEHLKVQAATNSPNFFYREKYLELACLVNQEDRYRKHWLLLWGVCESVSPQLGLIASKLSNFMDGANLLELQGYLLSSIQHHVYDTLRQIINSVTHEISYRLFAGCISNRHIIEGVHPWFAKVMPATDSTEFGLILTSINNKLIQPALDGIHALNLLKIVFGARPDAEGFSENCLSFCYCMARLLDDGSSRLSMMSDYSFPEWNSVVALVRCVSNNAFGESVAYELTDFMEAWLNDNAHISSTSEDSESDLDGFIDYEEEEEFRTQNKFIAEIELRPDLREYITGSIMQ